MLALYPLFEFIISGYHVEEVPYSDVKDFLYNMKDANNTKYKNYVIKDNKIIAVLIINKTPITLPKDIKNSVEIKFFGVDPNYRFRGVGATLVNTIIDKYQKENKSNIIFNTKSISNPNSLRMFSFSGFKNIDNTPWWVLSL